MLHAKTGLSFHLLREAPGDHLELCLHSKPSFPHSNSAYHPENVLLPPPQLKGNLFQDTVLWAQLFLQKITYYPSKIAYSCTLHFPLPQEEDFYASNICPFLWVSYFVGHLYLRTLIYLFTCFFSCCSVSSFQQNFRGQRGIVLAFTPFTFNLHNNTTRQVPFPFPFYRWRKWTFYKELPGSFGVALFWGWLVNLGASSLCARNKDRLKSNC